MIKDRNHIDRAKNNLLSALKAEHAFWSYDLTSITIENIDDEQLIALTMRYQSQAP